MPPDQPQQRTIALGTPGRYRFVAITSGSPIHAVALEQAGAGARGVGVPPTTDWTATLVEIMVR